MPFSKSWVQFVFLSTSILSPPHCCVSLIVIELQQQWDNFLLILPFTIAFYFISLCRFRNALMLIYKKMQIKYFAFVLFLIHFPVFHRVSSWELENDDDKNKANRIVLFTPNSRFFVFIWIKKCLCMWILCDCFYYYYYCVIP